jgi:4-aminobutyrate aminotransferase-like enzyme/aminoglycoside phosphotransferase (APT) family kinase protein
MTDHERLVADVFGVTGDCTPLPGEIDENGKVTAPDGRCYRLRISPPETESALTFRRSVLEAAAGARVETPAPIPTADGVAWAHLDDGRTAHLSTWIDGVAYSEAGRPPELAHAIGVAAGTIVNVLAGLPGGPRPSGFLWDLSEARTIIAERTNAIQDPLRRILIDRVLARYDEIAFRALPRQVVHNDLNDENVLLRDGAVAGVIDFGDAIETIRAAELAIACTYAMLGQDDPVTVAGDLIAGYRSVAPLTAAEAGALLDLILARLATSVVVSASRGGANPHHTISEDLAWDLLERLLAGDVDAVAAELAAAGTGRRAPSTQRAALLELRSTLGSSLSLSYEEPLTIVRGRGQYLFDERGRRYLDGVNNVCHVGHANPAVAEAGAEQSFTLNTNTRYLHPEILRYAERVLATLPEQLDRVYLVNSGSEANELAIRLVRTATGRTDMVCLDHGYHGNTSTLIDVSPYKFNAPGGAGKRHWVHVLPSPDPYRVEELNGPDAAAVYRKLARDVLADAAPAGFIVETLPGCGGQIIPPPGLLGAAYDEVRARGGLVIADEVQTGFGRTGVFWAFQRDNLEPDVVTMGKPAGNGHPLGVVATTRAIAEAFDNGMEYFNTFGGNPVSAAVGNAVLDEIERLDVVNYGATLGRHLLGSLSALAERHRAIGDVRGAGLYLGVELVEDRVSKHPATALAGAIVEYAKERGVLLSTDGPFGNVIKIKPPMVFNSADAERLVGVVDRALSVVDA